MITGRDTLQEINNHLLNAQSRIQATDREMNDLNAQLNRFRIETAEKLRQLATFRLDEIKAGNITTRMSRARLAVPAFMDQHQQALATLNEDINRSQQRQQALEQARSTHRDARDRAADTLLKQIKKSKSKLETNADYGRLQEQAAAAVQVAERADNKASRSEADLEDKGKPYQEDALFMYLWDRRFLSPDYRHGGIIRMLDGWVATLIGFKELRADYHMLNELPRRLREHATKAAGVAESQQQALLRMEKQAAEKDGVPALQTALEAAENALQQINNDIEAEEKQYQALSHQRNEFAAGEDQFTRKAVTLLAAELEREDTIILLQEAQNTPRPEDDAIVMRLHQVQKEQKTATDRLAALKSNQDQQRQALEELTRLREKFRRSNYDARRSSFPADLGLGVLLGEILRGGRSAGRTWDHIGRSQRWDFPDIGRSGGGRVGRSSGGFGGFGGFGSGGGFGGGGFHSGGGF